MSSSFLRLLIINIKLMVLTFNYMLHFLKLLDKTRYSMRDFLSNFFFSSRDSFLLRRSQFQFLLCRREGTWKADRLLGEVVR
jgi:hypothetical protein